MPRSIVTTSLSSAETTRWSVRFVVSLVVTVILHEIAHILVGWAWLGRWPDASGIATLTATGRAMGAAAGPAASAAMAMLAVRRQRRARTSRGRSWWTCAGLAALLRFVLTWPLVVGWLTGWLPGAYFDELHIAAGSAPGVALLLAIELALVFSLGPALARAIPSETRAPAWLGIGAGAAVGTVLVVLLQPMV